MNLREIASGAIEWQIISIKDDPDVARDVQRQLTILGFRLGAIDGIWGNATQSAYQSFAKASKFDPNVMTPAIARLLLQARPAPAPAPAPAPPRPTPPSPTPTPGGKTPSPTPQPPPHPTSPTPTPSPGGQTAPPKPAPPPTPPKPAPPNSGQPSRSLTDADYRAVAQMIGCQIAAVRAIVEIESSGSGFLPDGRPKILFEAQWFSEFTDGQYDTSQPDISSVRWNPDLYLGGAREWTRLEKAIKLDRTAALKAASWGLGQIMGFNFPSAGYKDVESFVKDMHISEGKQLTAMFNFIKSQKLDRFLINRDWAGFALRYNGEGYRQNRYDEKLAAAFHKWSVMG